MNIQVYRDPIYHLVIEDFFSKHINKNILDEAVKNQRKFEDSTTYGGKNKKFRSNKVAFYDEMYKPDRSKSALLTEIDNLFRDNKKFREVLDSSPYPLHYFTRTDYHETQVSRYGDNEEYKWHIDAGAGGSRTITVIYYFNAEPKKWSSGKLRLTNSPIYDGQTIESPANIKVIEPKNNMLLIFSSFVAHQVNPTKSPSKFRDGRFSVNCWVGTR